MPVLYLVATPIGNLEDITLRAIRVLKEAALVAAEDTRTTRALFDRHGIATPLTSYTEHNHAEKTPGLLAKLAEGDIALVSEAGTPAINDPGHYLVAAALEAGFRVSPVPGPSAVVAAVAASGLPSEGFTFLGFLPHKQGERRRLLEAARQEPRSLVMFETPHRLQAALEDIEAVLGDRRMSAARELTKLHEEVFHGTVSEARDHFQQPRGEFTLVIEGTRNKELGTRDPEQAREALERLRAQGVRAKEAVAEVAGATGLPRRDVYRMWLELAGGAGSAKSNG